MKWRCHRLGTGLIGGPLGLIAGLTNGDAGIIGSSLRDVGLGTCADENTGRAGRTSIVHG